MQATREKTWTDKDGVLYFPAREAQRGRRQVTAGREPAPTWPEARAVASPKFVKVPEPFVRSTNPTPEDALEWLKQGNARFASDRPVFKDTSRKRRVALARGQQPFAAIPTCADSRVAPEYIFDQGLGELYVLRVVGNVTDPAIIGSVEFAVAELKTPLVVVLGHEGCAGVQAALEEQAFDGDLGKLIQQIYIDEAATQDRATLSLRAICANALFHAGQLAKQSSSIRACVTRGVVRIVPAMYLLESGEVAWLENDPWTEGSDRLHEPESVRHG